MKIYAHFTFSHTLTEFNIYCRFHLRSWDISRDLTLEIRFFQIGCWYSAQKFPAERNLECIWYTAYKNNSRKRRIPCWGYSGIKCIESYSNLGDVRQREPSNCSHTWLGKCFLIMRTRITWSPNDFWIKMAVCVELRCWSSLFHHEYHTGEFELVHVLEQPLKFLLGIERSFYVLLGWQFKALKHWYEHLQKPVQFLPVGVLCISYTVSLVRSNALSVCKHSLRVVRLWCVRPSQRCGGIWEKWVWLQAVNNFMVHLCSFTVVLGHLLINE